MESSRSLTNVLHAVEIVGYACKTKLFSLKLIYYSNFPLFFRKFFALPEYVHYPF
jgi:hypothetical protein